MGSAEETHSSLDHEPKAKQQVANILQPRKAAKKSQALSPIEMANKASSEDFIHDYLKPEPDWTEWTHPSTQSHYTLSLLQSGHLSAEELKSCFEVIESTSGNDYRGSSLGWHPAMKGKEMRSPDLRYILVKDESNIIKGFTSLMPTFENHEQVVYCYEIHLLPELQRTGLGKKLLGYLMTIAENIPSTEKVMLTCFTSNSSGLKFYDKMGFTTDDFSPRERKLRGGKVVMPDYVILSRRTRQSRPGAPARE
ncbi:N-alpha-acetyltransferase 40 [Cladobotryum mycophilum]|uniref:N-alpha-acetyltransferase 40 n=1 Tax=Cladobotryum mycophilum TaxID=491253 RepID=A0ABR0SM69_9HYPO